MTDEEFLAEYKRLGHAIQTGIGWKIQLDTGSPDVNSDPNLNAHKHLRVGIDTNKADLGSISRLLVKKGLISDDEFKQAILEGLELEKASYEDQLNERFGLSGSARIKLA